MTIESESEVNESENPSDFGFVKNCQNPTTFGFRFELHHIPSFYTVYEYSHFKILTYSKCV